MIEKIVGIDGYITKTKGMDGSIRSKPADFLVEEISNIKACHEGDYLLVKVKKTNWDTLNFVRVLSNALGISQKRISFAGTKDKRSTSIQYFSIKGIKAENIQNLKIKDAKIEVIGYINRPLRLGDLVGNFFKIKIEKYRNGHLFGETRSEIEKLGLPNFFGLQRFGTARFITHEVGKLILQKKFEDAFWVYVAKPFYGENRKVFEIRKLVWESRDEKLGLREYPKYLRYERFLLQKIREGMNERDALLHLPKNLKLMFVHAYQSYIFNRLLSERIREFGDLKTIDVGDWACYLTYKYGKPTFYDCSFVGTNKPRVRYLVERRYASLALPLVGYKTHLTGWSSKAKEILAEDNLDLKDFKSDYKEFSSSGSYRPADMIIEITDISFENSIFSFYLPKGCYATIALREFIKSEIL